VGRVWAEFGFDFEDGSQDVSHGAGDDGFGQAEEGDFFRFWAVLDFGMGD
jgi:hypothetical protein